MYGYIYKVTDLQTGLIYVGQKKSTTFLYKKYLGSGTDMSRFKTSPDFDIDRFDVEMIDTAESAAELNDKEIYWIKELNARDKSVGYNRCNGGITNAGFVQSDYQKQIAADYMKNRTVTDVTRMNMSVSAHNRVDNRVTNNGQIWVHTDTDECMIEVEELADYIRKGYAEGRIPKTDDEKNQLKDKYQTSTYIIKNNTCILVSNNELDSYLQSGWAIGRKYSDNHGSQISKGKSGTIRIVNLETGTCKYIKPELLDDFRIKGYVTSAEYKEKKTS